MFVTFGVQRAVILGAHQASALGRKRHSAGEKHQSAKRSAMKSTAGVGRVEQIARIEAVIAQFVEHDFVGREINRAFVGRAHGIDREQQARFRSCEACKPYFA